MSEITEVQRVVLDRLTDQRGANVLLLADIIGDMDSDDLAMLRILTSNDDKQKMLRKFLLTTEPDTLSFLSQSRPDEIASLKDAIALWMALMKVGKLGRWFVMIFLGTVVSAVAAYHTIIPIIRGGK